MVKITTMSTTTTCIHTLQKKTNYLSWVISLPTGVRWAGLMTANKNKEHRSNPPERAELLPDRVAMAPHQVPNLPLISHPLGVKEKDSKRLVYCNVGDAKRAL